MIHSGHIEGRAYAIFGTEISRSIMIKVCAASAALCDTVLEVSRDAWGIGSSLEQISNKLLSAEAAVEVVKPGHRVFVGTACAAPFTLVEALERRRGNNGHDADVTRCLLMIHSGRMHAVRGWGIMILHLEGMEP
jgi:hypothetical protein